MQLLELGTLLNQWIVLPKVSELWSNDFRCVFREGQARSGKQTFPHGETLVWCCAELLCLSNFSQVGPPTSMHSHCWRNNICVEKFLKDVFFCWPYTEPFSSNWFLVGKDANPLICFLHCSISEKPLMIFSWLTRTRKNFLLQMICSQPHCFVMWLRLPNLSGVAR